MAKNGKRGQIRCSVCGDRTRTNVVLKWHRTADGLIYHVCAACSEDRKVNSDSVLKYSCTLSKTDVFQGAEKAMEYMENALKRGSEYDFHWNNLDMDNWATIYSDYEEYNAITDDEMAIENGIAERYRRALDRAKEKGWKVNGLA